MATVAATWTSNAGTTITLNTSVTTTRSRNGNTTTAAWDTTCSACGTLGTYASGFNDTQPRQDAVSLAFGHISTCPGA